VVTDSHFLLFTGLCAYSPALFVAFHPFWLQNGLEISVVTLMVGYILYAVDPPQTPTLPLTLLLTIHILFPFLAQIPPLTQLHGPRPFALAFALTLPFQILSSTSKIFSVLNSLTISSSGFSSLFTCFFTLLFPIS